MKGKKGFHIRKIAYYRAIVFHQSFVRSRVCIWFRFVDPIKH